MIVRVKKMFMDNTCFIIMPIADCDPYPIGHFKRVYEHLIKPAVINAGFIPIRADDVLNTNYIALDIIKRIIDSDMAVCDLSSRNPNVFYELGIRQAFNRPVTLLRDSRSSRVFDIQGFRDIEYDENLRIDNVEQAIATISDTIINTYKTQGNEINSLIALLGIQPAKVSASIEISKDTALILDTLSSIGSRLNEITNILPLKKATSTGFSLNDLGGVWETLTAAETSQLDADDIIDHSKFGKGRIVKRIGTNENPIIEVIFESGDEKKLMCNYIQVKKLNKSSTIT